MNKTILILILILILMVRRPIGIGPLTHWPENTITMVRKLICPKTFTLSLGYHCADAHGHGMGIAIDHCHCIGPKTKINLED